MQVIEPKQTTGVQMNQMAASAAQQNNRVAAHTTAAADVDINEAGAATGQAHERSVSKSLAAVNGYKGELGPSVTLANAGYAHVRHAWRTRHIDVRDVAAVGG